jgi:hypothetical protein
MDVYQQLLLGMIEDRLIELEDEINEADNDEDIKILTAEYGEAFHIYKKIELLYASM